MAQTVQISGAAHLQISLFFEAPGPSNSTVTEANILQGMPRIMAVKNTHIVKYFYFYTKNNSSGWGRENV